MTVIERRLKFRQKGRSGDLTFCCEGEARSGSFAGHLLIDGVQKYRSVGFDVFDCMLAIREKAEEDEIVLCCMGARIDVWPSGMARQMSMGEAAYVHEIAKTGGELVSVLDHYDGPNLSTVEAQRVFISKWRDSIVSSDATGGKYKMSEEEVVEMSGQSAYLAWKKRTGRS